MSAKVTLGQRPASFVSTITFQDLDGSDLAMQVTFKYRTRDEFGQLLDEAFAAAPATPAETDPIEAGSMQRLFSGTTLQNAIFLGKIVQSWNLDEPFTPETVHQLCKEFPQAFHAISVAYREAVVDGRRGN